MNGNSTLKTTIATLNKNSQKYKTAKQTQFIRLTFFFFFASHPLPSFSPSLPFILPLQFISLLENQRWGRISRTRWLATRTELEHQRRIPSERTLFTRILFSVVSDPLLLGSRSPV